MVGQSACLLALCVSLFERERERIFEFAKKKELAMIEARESWGGGRRGGSENSIMRGAYEWSCGIYKISERRNFEFDKEKDFLALDDKPCTPPYWDHLW